MFAKLFHVSAGSSGSATVGWVPPAEAWRARASFLGTDTASPSQSGFTSLSVG